MESTKGLKRKTFLVYLRSTMSRINNPIFHVYWLLLYCSSIVSSFNVTTAMLQIPLGFSLSNIEHYLSMASNNKSDIAIFPSSIFNGSCISWSQTTKSWCLKYNLAIAISCDNLSLTENLTH